MAKQSISKFNQLRSRRACVDRITPSSLKEVFALSEEIRLNPGKAKENLNEIRTAIQHVIPTEKSYDGGETILETIEQAKENMENFQQLLQNYQSLVLGNVSDIESLINKFEESETAVASNIKGGSVG